MEIKNEKKILEEFVSSLNEALDTWAISASNFKLSVAASVVPIDLKKIAKLINSRLDNIRNELRIQYEYYQELEEEHGLKPLSFAYLSKYAALVSELETRVKEVKMIADKYNELMKRISSDLDINQYINHKNQKAIERLQELDVGKLLQILSDNDLFGF